MKIGSDGLTVRQAWGVTWILGTASYLDASAIAGTGTALVLFQDGLSLTGTDIGRLSALLTVCIAIGALFGGRLGDRFGRRRVFTVTMVVFAAAALLLTASTGIVPLYIGLALLGLASGADLPVSLSMIGEAAPDDKRGRMIGLSQGLWVVGIVAAILIGMLFGDLGAVAGRIMYGHLFAVSALVLVARLWIPESSKWRAAEDTRSAGIADPDGGTDIGALRKLFTSRFVLPLVALGLFFGIANISANTNGQFQTYLYVNVAGTDVPTASAFGLVSIGLGFSSMLLFMKLVDDARMRTAMLWAAAVMAVAAFALPAVAGVHVWTLVTSTVLYSLGGGIIGEPMYKVWSQEIIPTLFRSSVQGITIAFTRLVAAGVALVTPAIIATGPTNLYYFLVATTLVSVAIGLFWLPRFPRANEEAGIGGAPSAAPAGDVPSA
ncbi:MFS transporter [Nocardiopsis sp. RSe5-2]|uniref:MFS transporter n=1 Tax=Nocardiopsis endophytica TaxID=3018445 RepID=A0ABT4TXF0_9ACTN|nr:MFS transporter [Nocardiopsis endophytica]MDA2809363.1 MFS transporter [Nocardiopsis endophytica]